MDLPPPSYLLKTGEHAAAPASLSLTREMALKINEFTSQNVALS